MTGDINPEVDSALWQDLAPSTRQGAAECCCSQVGLLVLVDAAGIGKKPLLGPQPSAHVIPRGAAIRSRPSCSTWAFGAASKGFWDFLRFKLELLFNVALSIGKRYFC